MEKRTGKAIMVATAILALIASTCLAMSIDTEPVKVTHRNSGPRYDITADNEVERTRMTAEEPTPPQAAGPASPDGQPEGEQAGDPMPIGHVAIRRIYLFPLMRGPSSSEGDAEGDQPSHPPPPPQSDHDQQPLPSMFAKPFWPFLTPARPSPAHRQYDRPHLFGADEASRSPQDQDRAASGGEREEPAVHRGHPMEPQQQQPQQQPQRPEQPLFDPIQMMLNMMHQAINAQMVPPGDLSNDNKNTNNDNSPSESSSDELPKRPSFLPKPSQNESCEEIVEIDGKKYMRKTIVNRHIGENIIFMTKRLIFVPLNETDSTTTETVATTTTSTSTGSPTTTTTEVPSVIPDRVGDNKPITTTTTTTTTSAPATSESPATTTTATNNNNEDAPTKGPEGPLVTSPAGSTEQPSTTGATTEPAPATESASTPRSTESIVDRVSDIIDKAAERLVEEVKPSTTSTEAPVVSSTSA